MADPDPINRPCASAPYKPRAHDHLKDLYEAAQRLIAWGVIGSLEREGKRSVQELLSGWDPGYGRLQEAADGLYGAGMTSKPASAPPHLILLDRAKLDEYVKTRLAALDGELINRAIGLRVSNELTERRDPIPRAEMPGSECPQTSRWSIC